jgi:hypothetical protein
MARRGKAGLSEPFGSPHLSGSVGDEGLARRGYSASQRWRGTVTRSVIAGAVVGLLPGCLMLMPDQLAMMGTQLASDYYARGMLSSDACLQHQMALHRAGWSPAAVQAELVNVGCAQGTPSTTASNVQPSRPAAPRSDPFVAEIQSRLNQAGYDAGAVDGRMGPRTTNAIKAFQRDRGLPEDGLPTPGVLLELDKAPKSAEASKSAKADEVATVTDAVDE